MTLFEPPGLRNLVNRMQYKPGWILSVQESFEKQADGSFAGGLVFEIISDTEDSLNPTKRMRVRHHFLIPPATYNEVNWKAWLVDRLGDVEMHERNEFVQFDGVREFAPHHGNGEDPYRTWHVSDFATAAKKSGDE